MPSGGTASGAASYSFKLPPWSRDPNQRSQTRDESAVPQPVPEFYTRDGQSKPYLGYMYSAERKYGIPWYVLAAISWQETKHATDPGTWIPTVGDGSVGPMQFIESTWQFYKQDSEDEGPDMDKLSVGDQIHAAANLLKENRFTDGPEGVLAAFNAYNPYSRNPWWTHDVLFWAEKYAASGPGTGGIATVEGSICSGQDDAELSKVVAFVKEQVARTPPVPYIWGAEGPDAFDCSGLMVAAYKTIDVNIPRTTAMQADSDQIEIVMRAPITDRESLRPGDLLFIDNGGKRVEDRSNRLGGRYIGHVAMYLGGGEVGEASSPAVGLKITKFEGRWDSVVAVGRVKGLNVGGGSAGTWAKPVHPAIVTSEWGMRDGEMHKGLDFGLDCGEPIFAVADGTVILASRTVKGYGTYVLVDHGGGWHTGYGHPVAMLIPAGQRVRQGQHIADVGREGNSTGCHLHFDVWKNAKPGVPWSGEQTDPKPVLQDHGVNYW